MKRLHYFLHLFLLVALVVLDQVTKYFAKTMLPGKPNSLIDGVFSLYYHENRGSVWGILQGKIDFLLIASIFIFALIIYAYIKIPKTKQYQPLILLIVLIAAGAIGNTIDRAFFGYVTDFLYFELINFPIFNVADCYITVSMFLGVILVFTKYRNDDFSFLSLRRKDSKHVTDTKSHED